MSANPKPEDGIMLSPEALSAEVDVIRAYEAVVYAPPGKGATFFNRPEQLSHEMAREDQLAERLHIAINTLAHVAAGDAQRELDQLTLQPAAESQPGKQVVQLNTNPLMEFKL